MNPLKRFMRAVLAGTAGPLPAEFVVRERPYVVGRVTVELRGPDGGLKHFEIGYNLVTDVGDQYCAKKIYSAPTAAAGMKLGTATTASAKSGAGAFIATSSDYISGSAQAFDATYPKQGTTAKDVDFKVTYAAGTATNSTINRVSITDNTTNAGEADATHTYSVFKFASTIDKQAADTLAVTWTWSFLGA